MAIKIDRFNVINKARGRAKILASFDVNLGPMSIRGFEIVEAGGKRFISVPANVYEKGHKGSGDWDRFNYIVYNKGKGESIEKEVQDRAFEELERRAGSFSQQQGAAAGNPNNYDPFSNDDGLPFS